MRTLFGEDEASASPRTGGVYVRVAVERGIDRSDGKGDRRGAGKGGDGTLTYWTDSEVQVGDRVDVPLGRGDALAAGIVVEVGGVELLDGFDPARVKAVGRVVGTRLPENLVELARWMAGYYVCPLGMVLATMMPAAVKHGTGKRRRRLLALATSQPGTDKPAPASSPTPPLPPPLPPSARRAWERIAGLDAEVFPIAPKELAALIEAETLGPINRLVRAGLLREVECEEISARELSSLSPPAPPTPDGVMARPAAPTLTPAQRRVVEGISATIGGFAAHLLRGVTGSGKTEVYLRVMERVLERGQSALVLVPEISLTPQTAGRFEARFGLAAGGGGVAVLHSGLTASQRHKQWARVAAGECRVVVGARSAVFAPLRNLGLIVVDEEHDASYKQDQLPRYHGRDVAIKRAHLEGCPIILGSATPSMESWANAAHGRGGARYTLWTLEERVAGGTLPRVELVDITEERRLAHSGGQRPGLIGPTLGRALRRTLEEGGQAILLLNRRGFANYICCLDQRCGWSLRCDQCDAGMVHHRINPVRPGGFVRCHHCLSEQRMPKVCPLCEGKVGVLGAGTQRVEEELVGRFGLVEGETFLRVDGDTMRSARDYFDALTRFGAGEVKVLLGTQMISKGLDYPNVRLVGVIDADTSLHLPDFRAAERTFQLVSQVAGRAGRGSHPGRVVVQTMNPDNPAVRLAAKHDYVAFAEQELAIRRRSGLPPATRMARIVVRDEDATRAESHAHAVAEALRAAAATVPGGDRIRMDGPAPCPMSRLANFYRFGIELTADSRGVLQAVLGAARAAGAVKSDARTAVDVDPLALL